MARTQGAQQAYRGEVGMSNPCGFTATSFQDIADLLCVLYNQEVSTQTDVDDTRNSVVLIRDRLGDPGGGTNIDAKINDVLDGETLIETMIGALGTNVGIVNTNVVNTKSDLDGLKLWVGDPAGGPNLYSVATSTKNAVDDVGDDADELIDSIGARVGGQPTVLASVYDFAHSEWVSLQVNDVKTATQHGGINIGDILGALLFGKFGGGTQLIDLVSQVAAVWNAPPLALLTQLTGVGFTGSVSIARPAGVYGYALTAVVPSYWGRKCNDPIIYQPPIGYAAWRGTYGTVGTPITLVTPQQLIYPLPTGADHLDITLEPGITGTYYPLAF